MSAMITPELVVLDTSLGTDRAGVIRRLAELVVAQGRADQVEGLFADALAREEKTATGIPGGLTPSSAFALDLAVLWQRGDILPAFG